MLDHTFNSRIRDIGTFRSNWSDEEVKNEPMLFSCSIDAARELGGPITRAFLDALPEGWEDAIVDSRVHMLMPGWFPCIPGYHHDDVPRSGHAGQPNYDNPEYLAEHVLGLVNAHICPTAFALGSADFPRPKPGEIAYGLWHPIVEAKIAEGELEMVEAKSGVITYFDHQSWHTGTAAKENGWRWFIRVTRNTHRKPTNEIRRQVQVYLINDPMKGW